MNTENNQPVLDEVDEIITNFYKRYNTAMKTRQRENFVAELNQEKLELSNYQKVAELIAEDDIRFIPVIACAYADDLLKFTFKAILPSDVLGGIDNMLSIYGPLSDFSKRLNLAHAFDVFSPNLLKDINIVRSIRNTISHSWEIQEIDSFISAKASNITAVEEIFSNDSLLTLEDSIQDNPFKLFRFRLIWTLGAMFYESPIYYRAKKDGINPQEALYGKSPPNRLGKIAKICYNACKKGKCWPFNEYKTQIKR